MAGRRKTGGSRRLSVVLREVLSRATLPLGAVPGDVSKQVFCPAHHEPKYFYLNEKRSCIQCGKAFVFRAAEQKFWYETLKFNFESIPIRCPRCRKLRRSERSLREQIGRARRDAKMHPNDPAPQLALSRALVEFHERTGQGRLPDAIAAARRAARLWPQSSEPLLWEGLAHAQSGRKNKALDCLKRFLAAPGNSHGSLLRIARDYLAENGG